MNKKASQKYGIDGKALDMIRRLQEVTNVTVVVFGSPYSLKYFDNSRTVVMAYDDNKQAQNAAAQVLFGGIGAKGRLPVTASPGFRFGQGLMTSYGMRFKYTIPEDTGIDSRDFQQIDYIVDNAIKNKALPGCQVFVAKDGKVIFEKAYGHHTYNKRIAVKESDLYDVASITKIASSLLGIMEMIDVGRLSLNSRLGDILPSVNGTNKSNLIVKEILIHESGLVDWIPFYKETMPGKSLYHSIYRKKKGGNFTIEVAKNMYMDKNYTSNIWHTINNSSLHSKVYRYSDVGYYYFKAAIEHYAHQPLDEYIDKRYYKVMGLPTGLL